MSKPSPAGMAGLQDGWLNRIKLKYTPLSDDIYAHKKTARLSELLCAIDNHYFLALEKTGIEDDLGYGQKSEYRILPITKTDGDIEIETYLAATVVNDSVLIITADDSGRLDAYKELNEIEAQNIEFKRDEIFIVLKELAGKHGIEPEQVKFINYTHDKLSEHAQMHQEPASREYLRTIYEHTKGMDGFASVYCPDGEYLVSQIKDTQITGIALSEHEQIIFDMNHKQAPSDKGESVDFEHLGHSFDSDSAINKVAVTRFLINSLKAMQKNYENEIIKKAPEVEKNDNVRVTCGDHLVSVRNKWNDADAILKVLHQEGLTDLTKEDITETFTETSRKINVKKLEQALLDVGIDVKEAQHKNSTFSVVATTNTTAFKEHHADIVDENIKAICEGVENKLDMYEPGDKEENAAESAEEIGYGVKP